MTSSLTIQTVPAPNDPARRRLLIAGAALTAAVVGFGVAQTYQNADPAPRSAVQTDRAAAGPLVVESMHPAEAAFLAGDVRAASAPLVVESMHPAEAAFLAGDVDRGVVAGDWTLHPAEAAFLAGDVRSASAPLVVESMHPAEAAFLAGQAGVTTHGSDDPDFVPPTCVVGAPC